MVEVDGIQHSWASQIVGDAIRQNDIDAAGGACPEAPAARAPVSPDDFFGQIEQALASGRLDAPVVPPEPRTSYEPVSCDQGG